ncbi:hypothetical protein EVAR_86479_1 [Eumeta japonica]|uniref:Uncharacterized protein n=1 Tax=Eumeta variegata TaxID=151549 RepID=A0A4C1VNR8_EUMVA|nr:hypothetical protein EVAR_86479_1 [Eumeta japonica]
MGPSINYVTRLEEGPGGRRGQQNETMPRQGAGRKLCDLKSECSFEPRSGGVGLRACMSVCSAAQCTSRGDSYATFAFVPVIRSGLLHRLHAEPTYGFCA